MSTHTNNITLRSSAAIIAAGTTYSSIFSVDKYDELNLFLHISAQTGYTSGDSLTVSVQIVDPDGNYVDLTGATFDAVTEVSTTHSAHIGIVAFGSRIRLKYVVAADGAVSYTFTVKAYGKGNF